MKTAVSIPDNLFHDIERLASELKVSRSRIFAEALRDYMERRENEKILEALNRVYAEPETAKEREVRRHATRQYATLLKREKW